MNRIAIIAVLCLLVSINVRSQTYPDNCLPSEEMSRLREIMLGAVDQALKEHIVRLFDVWMKDPSDQPARAVAGARPALTAHANARAAIMQWKPQACEDKK
jgi:hypothetical protein